MNRVRILLRKVLSLEKKKKEREEAALQSCQPCECQTHAVYMNTHTRRCITCLCNTRSRGNNRVYKRGADRLTHVNKNTYMVHRRKETKLLGPSLLWSRGVLKLPAPNNICCSLLPLLAADEEGVPTRVFFFFLLLTAEKVTNSTLRLAEKNSEIALISTMALPIWFLCKQLASGRDLIGGVNRGNLQNW